MLFKSKTNSVSAKVKVFKLIFSRGTIFNPIIGKENTHFFQACEDSNECKQDVDGFTCQVKLKIYTFSWKDIKCSRVQYKVE